MTEEKVILVNENDEPRGAMDKQEAHMTGILHRAFSVFIFNTRGEMLLQQRALGKYHSGGLWTNTCCSHPQPEEVTIDAAKRRLKEEMGIEAEIEKIFDFVYKVEFENGLTEHEFDHVYAGEYEGRIEANPAEVKDFCYKDMNAIKESLQSHPQKYTAWFSLAFPGVEKWWKQNYRHVTI